MVLRCCDAEAVLCLSLLLVHPVIFVSSHFISSQVPEEESDLVLLSTRKSEIVTELADAAKATGRELKVKFGNE